MRPAESFVSSYSPPLQSPPVRRPADTFVSSAVASTLANNRHEPQKSPPSQLTPPSPFGEHLAEATQHIKKLLAIAPEASTVPPQVTEQDPVITPALPADLDMFNAPTLKVVVLDSKKPAPTPTPTTDPLRAAEKSIAVDNESIFDDDAFPSLADGVSLGKSSNSSGSESREDRKKSSSKRDKPLDASNVNTPRGRQRAARPKPTADSKSAWTGSIGAPYALASCPARAQALLFLLKRLIYPKAESMDWKAFKDEILPKEELESSDTRWVIQKQQHWNEVEDLVLSLGLRTDGAMVRADRRAFDTDRLTPLQFQLPVDLELQKDELARPDEDVIPAKSRRARKKQERESYENGLKLKALQEKISAARQQHESTVTEVRKLVKEAHPVVLDSQSQSLHRLCSRMLPDLHKTYIQEVQIKLTSYAPYRDKLAAIALRGASDLMEVVCSVVDPADWGVLAAWLSGPVVVDDFAKGVSLREAVAFVETLVNQAPYLLTMSMKPSTVLPTDPSSESDLELKLHSLTTSMPDTGSLLVFQLARLLTHLSNIQVLHLDLAAELLEQPNMSDAHKNGVRWHLDEALKLWRFITEAGTRAKFMQSEPRRGTLPTSSFRLYVPWQHQLSSRVLLTSPPALSEPGDVDSDTREAKTAGLDAIRSQWTSLSLLFLQMDQRRLKKLMAGYHNVVVQGGAAACTWYPRIRRALQLAKPGTSDELEADAARLRKTLEPRFAQLVDAVIPIPLNTVPLISTSPYKGYRPHWKWTESEAADYNAACKKVDIEDPHYLKLGLLPTALVNRTSASVARLSRHLKGNSAQTLEDAEEILQSIVKMRRGRGSNDATPTIEELESSDETPSQVTFEVVDSYLVHSTSKQWALTPRSHFRIPQSLKDCLMSSKVAFGDVFNTPDDEECLGRELQTVTGPTIKITRS
ncbi:MAG: hypothetical protein KVP17_003188 [Porospora cf. gigantea B]|nr:MAG: hypothetical protein KVP17_003188 [Porospora cf. gigantea B]